MVRVINRFPLNYLMNVFFNGRIEFHLVHDYVLNNNSLIYYIRTCLQCVRLDTIYVSGTKQD